LRRRVDLLDASRMTANTSGETARRVSEFFGDGGPFSYRMVRKITPVLLAGELPFSVATLGIDRVKFDLARECNLDVATLVAECTNFRGRTFYALEEVLYAIDTEFVISLKPETVAVIDGVPNLIFLQPRKHPTLWAYNASFIRRVLEERYIPDYYEKAKFWLIDTEAFGSEERKLNLVDLQSVASMTYREFRRRIAALRAAWKLYLAAPARRSGKPTSPNTDQLDFDI